MSKLNGEYILFYLFIILKTFFLFYRGIENLYLLFGKEFSEVQKAIIMVIHFWYKFQKY